MGMELEVASVLRAALDCSLLNQHRAEHGSRWLIPRPKDQTTDTKHTAALF